MNFEGLVCEYRQCQHEKHCGEPAQSCLDAGRFVCRKHEIAGTYFISSSSPYDPLSEAIGKQNNRLDLAEGRRIRLTRELIEADK